LVRWGDLPKRRSPRCVETPTLCDSCNPECNFRVDKSYQIRSCLSIYHLRQWHFSYIFIGEKTMSIQLDHSIVPSRKKVAAAL
jgi:hypothetical protein